MKIGNVKVDNNVFLAPMAGVTDMSFRLLCKEMGVGLVYTEMVSAKGLYYGDENTKELMTIDEKERPVALQIFGSDPKIMANVVYNKLNSMADVDLIDINMGCPINKVTSSGDGSALLKDPKKAGEIISCVARAVDVPVTVKLRIGYNEINVKEMAKIAQESGAAAITVHGRTRSQMYSGKADLQAIALAKSVVSIPVIANGDIFSPQDALAMFEQTGCDGIMIGRGMMSNPWLVRDILSFFKSGEVPAPPTHSEKIQMALRHTRLLVKTKGEKVGCLEARGHLCRYIKGFLNANQLKIQIQTIRTYKDAEKILLGIEINTEENL